MKRPYPNLQISLAEGAIDLSWGHPDPSLLPVDAIRAAYESALRRYGNIAMPYGWMNGPAPVMEWLMSYIAETEGRAPDYEELVITAGNSWALDVLVTHLTKARDVILVEAPTYHYAVRILRDRENRLVAAPTDEDGIIVDALAERVRALKSEGAHPAMLYCVPTFNNPTGQSLAMQRRASLIELAAREGFVIVEDDVYRELAFDGKPLPSLWSMDTHGVVARMGSFAKSLAPGLRLGYISARRDLTDGIAHGGVIESGGGISHINALMLAEFARTGDYERNAGVLRAAYAARSAALQAALAEYAPQVQVRAPLGGYFAWAELPHGIDAETLLPRAQQAGTAFIPGSRFFIEGDGSQHLRLSHALYPPDVLREGVRRLGEAVRTRDG